MRQHFSTGFIRSSKSCIVAAIRLWVCTFSTHKTELLLTWCSKHSKCRAPYWSNRKYLLKLCCHGEWQTSASDQFSFVWAINSKLHAIAYSAVSWKNHLFTVLSFVVCCPSLSLWSALQLPFCHRCVRSLLIALTPKSVCQCKWNANNNFQFSSNSNNKSRDTTIKFKSQQIECSIPNKQKVAVARWRNGGGKNATHSHDALILFYRTFFRLRKIVEWPRVFNIRSFILNAMMRLKAFNDLEMDDQTKLSNQREKREWWKKILNMRFASKFAIAHKSLSISIVFWFFSRWFSPVEKTSNFERTFHF